MVCGQIHAPATLPIIYICISWTAFFSPPCSLLDLICFFFMPNNLRLPLRFFLKKREGLLREDVLRLRFVDTLEYEAQFTLPCFAVTRNVFVTACFVWKYSCCEPGFEELCHLDISKWSGSGHFCKITGQTFRQIVPSFAARISGVFADVETPGDQTGNH